MLLEQNQKEGPARLGEAFAVMGCFPSRSQNVNLAANWNCLGEFTVLVIRPKLF
jgi:hypothetical protein